MKSYDFLILPLQRPSSRKGIVGERVWSETSSGSLRLSTDRSDVVFINNSRTTYVRVRIRGRLCLLSGFRDGSSSKVRLPLFCIICSFYVVHRLPPSRYSFPPSLPSLVPAPQLCPTETSIDPWSDKGNESWTTPGPEVTGTGNHRLFCVLVLEFSKSRRRR